MLVAVPSRGDNRGVAQDYEPADYWSARLASEFSLRGTGHVCYSERYNRWLYRAKRRALRQALRGVTAPVRALDVGSGTGWVVEQLHARGFEVEGCDVAAVAVERLRAAYPTIEFFAAEWGSAPLPRPDAAYDVVTALDVAYHVVDDAAWERALADAARLLRVGGRLVVTDGLGASSASPAPHVRFRSEAAWRQAATTAGLELSELHRYASWLSRPRGRVSGDRLAGRVGDAVRGAVEYGLEVVAPRAAHLRCGVFVRRADVAGRSSV
jgi:SAM-dependent methyltransferase